MKYTQKCGAISIEVEELEIYIVINVSDNGIGIFEEEQAMVFQSFYRSEQVKMQEGIGVGLALTREIISRLQGQINDTDSLFI